MRNVGYDVEFFLRGGRGYIPAERVLRGTKGNAAALGEGVVGHPDNIMAEIASAGPFHHENLAERIRHDVEVLRKHVTPVDVVVTPSITVSDEFLAQSVLAGEIGCDVDYQDGLPRAPISVDILGNERHAGGHFHFDVAKDVPPEYAARVCDIMLAVPLIASGEKQGGRRATYGLPGLYRPKPYGLEYRTLSNYWVKLILEERSRTFEHMFNMTASAFLTLDDKVLSLPQKYWDYAQQIITAEDAGEAANLMATITGELK